MAKNQRKQPEECFVIMPITDAAPHESGHFRRVYEDIFAPAAEAAGYRPIRADDVKQTNLIQLDVLQRLLNSPMAICDLSTRNPNVLFELGLRQAFDKPVVLVQEVGTPPIFDIAPLRYTVYRSQRIYHEVIEDQEAVQKAIEETRDAAVQDAINSIVKLLSLTRPATLPEIEEADKAPGIQLIRSELSSIRAEIQQLANLRVHRRDIPSPYEQELAMLRREVKELAKTAAISTPEEIISLGLSKQLEALRIRFEMLANAVSRESKSFSHYSLNQLDYLYGQLQHLEAIVRSVRSSKKKGTKKPSKTPKD